MAVTSDASLSAACVLRLCCSLHTRVGRLCLLDGPAASPGGITGLSLVGHHTCLENSGEGFPLLPLLPPAHVVSCRESASTRPNRAGPSHCRPSSGLSTFPQHSEDWLLLGLPVGPAARAPGLHRHGPSSIPGWKWRSRKPRRAHPECCFLQPWVSGRATWPHAPSPGQAASPLLRQHPVFTLTSDYLCPGVCAVPESCSASSTCRFVSSTESADVVSRCFFEPLPSARRSQTRTRPHLLSSPPSVLSHVRWLSDFILLLSLSSEFVSLLRRICPNVCGTACDARLGV